ncbi:hypothetical protein QLQ12_12710 [Actinoplanes sp. NEAU-A12]|uniref:Uncharacterized protein n=1 Tax=Actinoplanes sandaracinus TaxID=3045177 RepID=A0ABT6WI93_9ACTN|nr:hypothetical protein [Actinoplanes sandaracinus]MDI6099456.1 hypothetical protein [Actinoplanes sandaracinus]
MTEEERPASPLRTAVHPASPAGRELMRTEVQRAEVTDVEGWFHCFGGLVDARQATAVLVGSVHQDDDEPNARQYVVRLHLPGGDTVTLRLGPYDDATFAHAVAETVVRRLFG